MGIMKFVHWFRSEPHRAKYGVDHPAFKAAKETWDYQQAHIEALEETIRQLYVMAAACPSDALADDFDFCTPLEQAEALLEGE